MTKAERIAAIAAHITQANREYHDALDAACVSGTPYALTNLDQAVRRCDALDELRVAAETSTDG